MPGPLDDDPNPWLHLPKTAPYVLPENLAALRRSSPRALANLVFAASPGPFIGNSLTAQVILLSLNPGWDESDLEAASNEAIQIPWLKPLRLRDDAVFHPIDPDLIRAGGSPYWSRKLRALIEAVGAGAVMAGVACVEWFPYQSRKFVPVNEPLPS